MFEDLFEGVIGGVCRAIRFVVVETIWFFFFDPFSWAYDKVRGQRYRGTRRTRRRRFSQSGHGYSGGPTG